MTRRFGEEENTGEKDESPNELEPNRDTPGGRIGYAVRGKVDNVAQEDAIGCIVLRTAISLDSNNVPSNDLQLVENQHCAPNAFWSSFSIIQRNDGYSKINRHVYQKIVATLFTYLTRHLHLGQLQTDRS